MPTHASACLHSPKATMVNTIPIPSIKLNTGPSIPAIGLGTWQSQPGEVAAAVETALKLTRIFSCPNLHNGYRHIDGAWIYGNEQEVGEGIKASGVDRSEIFITIKLWCTHQRDAAAAIEKSLKLLGVDYKEDGSRDLDLEKWSVAKTWEGMEKVYKSGKAKAIGISNFSEAFIEDLLKTAKVVPAANQIELHPYLPRHDLVKYCQGKNIAVEAYSPLGSTDSPLLKDEEIVKIAEAHGVSVGTILISYQVARNVVVLPKSVTPKRIIDNFQLVKLSSEDLETLNSMHKTKGKRFIKPDWGIDLKFANWD
ncbi:glycerol dehydrogenase [Microbotryum lychnidis-dioicae p1A1 Lamole]|uniref:Glycerol dehydrogenase n=1 Tax=Microbotryum lychnidis-dioicae (strain p1A1 Lamole / MvSl-1064) TaxID=683840 RepID=U5H1Y6_USTV1|nr:glycerol dehydrogenase [Microbotryum lychnidis-dioicae p1A1 Lamole]|eukprot:KDE08341.1 glycerol dehydrogenase [Microbotryum lychnidis-dioicae p1A1 Lamole]